MLIRRFFPSIIGAFVASVLLGLLSSAPPAMARVDIGAITFQSAAVHQEEPTCEARCERHANEVFLTCRAGGASIEVCADEARRARRECLEDCEGSDELTCIERCERHSRDVLHACLEAGEPAETCRLRALVSFKECAKDCDNSNPSCDDYCKARRANVIRECLEAGGGPDVCEHEGHDAYALCVAENCEPVKEPPAEPGCEDRCEETAHEVKRLCLESGGTGEECARKSRQAFERCVEACDRPADPPREPSCEQRCEDHAKEVRDACLEGAGGREECERKFHEAYEACVKEKCDRPADPPREPSCEGRCEDHAKEVRHACLEAGGGREECERKFHEAFKTCVKENCDRPADPPREPSCEQRCEDHAKEVRHTCLEGGGDREECERKFHETFKNCVKENCDRPADPPKEPRPPVDPPSCEKKCQARWEDVFRRCLADGRGEEECRAAANTERDACVHACERPPAPKPPSCEERCARYRAAVLRACLETGAGEDFCVREADEARERCTVQCLRPSVLPPGRDCDARCAQLGRLAYRRCIAGGGIAEACKVKARETTDTCMARCERPDPGGRRVIPIGR